MENKLLLRVFCLFLLCSNLYCETNLWYKDKISYELKTSIDSKIFICNENKKWNINLNSIEKINSDYIDFLLKENHSFSKSESSKINNDFNTKYVFDFSSEKLNSIWPINIKLGNYGANSLLSKLNNPALSAPISPFFSLNNSFDSQMQMNIQQGNLDKNPVIFVQAMHKNKENVFSKALVNVAYEPDSKSLIFGGNFTFTPSLNTKFSFNIYTSHNSYGENQSDSWFYEKDHYYYTSGEHFSFISQFNSSIRPTKNLKNNNLLSLFLYENPLRDYDFAIKLENGLKYKKSNFAGALFYCPKGIVLSSSGKNLEPQVQLKVSYFRDFLLKVQLPVFCKLGSCFYYKNSFYSPFNEYKVYLGFQALNSFGSSLIRTYFHYEDYFDVFGVNFRNKLNISDNNVELYGALTFNLAKEGGVDLINHKYSLSYNLFSIEKTMLSCWSSVNLTQKNEKISKSFLETGFNVSYYWRFLIFNCKFALNITLL